MLRRMVTLMAQSRGRFGDELFEVVHMKKIELKVKGMHCKSCDMLVKDELDEISGVNDVEASFKTGVVKFNAEDSVNIGAVKAKIRELGYEVV